MTNPTRLPLGGIYISTPSLPQHHSPEWIVVGSNELPCVQEMDRRLADIRGWRTPLGSPDPPRGVTSWGVERRGDGPFCSCGLGYRAPRLEACTVSAVTFNISCRPMCRRGSARWTSSTTSGCPSGSTVVSAGRPTETGAVCCGQSGQKRSHPWARTPPATGDKGRSSAAPSCLGAAARLAERQSHHALPQAGFVPPFMGAWSDSFFHSLAPATKRCSLDVAVRVRA